MLTLRKRQSIRAAVDRAIGAVAEVAGEGYPRATTRARDRESVEVRHAVIWVAKQLVPWASAAALGRALGGMHHTSVRYALRRMESGECQRALEIAVEALKAATRPSWSRPVGRGDAEAKALVAELGLLIQQCRLVMDRASRIMDGFQAAIDDDRRQAA